MSNVKLNIGKVLVRKRYGDKFALRELVSAKSLHYWLRVERRRMKTFVSHISNAAYEFGQCSVVSQMQSANLRGFDSGQATQGSATTEDSTVFVQSSAVDGCKHYPGAAGPPKK